MIEFGSDLDIIEAILNLKDPLDNGLRNICAWLGLRNLAYFGLPDFGSLQVPPCLCVSYDKEWVDHYRSRSYALSDPVLQEGMQSGRAIDWAGLRDRSDQTRRFFGEAAEFGVGQNGLTIPIMGRGSAIALVSFTSDLKPAEWHSFMAEQQSRLHLIGMAIHDQAWRNIPVADTGEPLSNRETECLKWAATGKTAFETSIILGLSERTTRHYLEMARRKLDAANITHAVVKAINANVLGVNF